MRSKLFAVTAVMLLMVSAGITMTPTTSAAIIPPGIPTTAVVGQQYSVDLRDHLGSEFDPWFSGDKSRIILPPAIIDLPNWISYSGLVNNGHANFPISEGGHFIWSGTPTEPGSYSIPTIRFMNGPPGQGGQVIYEVAWTITVLSVHTVTFDSYGGSFVPSRQVMAGDPYGTLPTPTKAGYTFQGWYDGATRVTASTVPTKDVTLKAQWSANNIQYTAPPTGNLAVGTYWSHQLSTTPGVVITVSGAGTSWLHVSGGTLSGMPPSAGVYEVSVLLTAPNYISQSKSFTLNVVPQLVLTNSPAAGAIAYVVG